MDQPFALTAVGFRVFNVAENITLWSEQHAIDLVRDQSAPRSVPD